MKAAKIAETAAPLPEAGTWAGRKVAGAHDRGETVLRTVEHVALYGWLVVILFPFAWMLSLALRKTEAQYTALFFPKEYTFENFVYLFQGTFPYRNIQINFLGTVKNSLIVTVASVALIICVSTLAAYAFATINFAGKKVAFYLILSGLMIPVQVIMLPLIKVNQMLHVQSSLLAVILPYTALGIPLSVFLLTGFFRNLPKELMEAATIEGANDWQILFKIVLPLSRPALGANIILQFMYTWNEFALALALLKTSNLFTLPIEISKVQGQYMTPWNIVATTVICAIVPVLIVYMIFQKQFIAGLTAGALKD
jgi:raffinose/stachyose/melibiose transport system permease protein